MPLIRPYILLRVVHSGRRWTSHQLGKYHIQILSLLVAYKYKRKLSLVVEFHST